MQIRSSCSPFILRETLVPFRDIGLLPLVGRNVGSPLFRRIASLETLRSFSFMSMRRVCPKLPRLAATTSRLEPYKRPCVSLAQAGTSAPVFRHPPRFFLSSRENPCSSDLIFVVVSTSPLARAGTIFQSTLNASFPPEPQLPLDDDNRPAVYLFRPLKFFIPLSRRSAFSL